MAPDTLSIDPKRGALAREAAWEIEALADQLIAFNLQHMTAEGDTLAVRGMSIRIRDLAGVVMNALTDEAGGGTVADIATTLRGKYVAEEARHG